MIPADSVLLQRLAKTAKTVLATTMGFDAVVENSSTQTPLSMFLI